MSSMIHAHYKPLSNGAMPIYAIGWVRDALASEREVHGIDIQQGRWYRALCNRHGCTEELAFLTQVVQNGVPPFWLIYVTAPGVEVVRPDYVRLHRRRLTPHDQPPGLRPAVMRRDGSRWVAARERELPSGCTRAFETIGLVVECPRPTCHCPNLLHVLGLEAETRTYIGMARAKHAARERRCATLNS